MKMKKFLALAMAMCMIFSMTTAAIAAEEGTSENPEKLVELKGDTITIPAGTSEDGYEGYLYNYTIPEEVEGIVQLSFSVDEASADEYLFNIDNLTSGDYAQIAPQYYETTTASLKASAGDVIQIKIMASGIWDDDYVVATYPTLDMTWSASVVSVGTEASPEVIETLKGYNGYQSDIQETVIPGTSGYYFSYEAEVTGTLSVFVNVNATVDPWVEYPDWYEDDPMLVDNINDLKAEVVLTNKTTNVVKKLSDGTTELVIATGYGSETYNVIQVPVTAGDTITINMSNNATGYADGVIMVCGVILQEPYGSAGNPVNVVKNNTEVVIPAGKTYFVSLEYPYMNYPLTIKGGEAVVLDYYGVEMEGLEDLVIEPVEEGWDTYYKFQIKNTSSADVKYTIFIDMPLGIEQNPEELDTNDKKEHTFDVEDTSRYFYSWTAEADGIVYFTVTSDSSWWYSVDNMTTEVWGAIVKSVDEEITHIAMDVNKGDVLSVYVSAMNYDEYTVDAVTKVTTTVKFVESLGSIVDVEIVDEIVSGIEDGQFDEEPIIELDMTKEDGSVATVIPAEIFNAIKEYNETLVNDYGEEPIDFTIVLDMGEYKWTIKNITNAVATDLGIDFEASNTDEEIIEDVADGNEYVTFEIGHNGDFGFDGELTFKVDVKYADKVAALYWDNNGTLEKVGTCTVAADGTVKYAFEHASDYVVIFEGTAVEKPVVDDVTGTTPEPTPNTGDMTSVVTLLAMAGLAAVVVLSRKKFVQE